MKTIILHISKKGDLKLVNIEGAGQSCDQVVAELQKKLGPVDESTREHTAEYYTKTDTNQDQEVDAG